MDYIEAREKLREAKRDALANSGNIKIGRRELEVALDALSKPDMREKVKEYISELNEELNRCRSWLNDNRDKLGSVNFERMYGRINALQEIKNDLKGRLEELL